MRRRAANCPPAAAVLAKVALTLLVLGMPTRVLPATVAPDARPAPAAKRPATQPVDINSATVTRLKSLPGIGDAEARRIVAGRPYLSKASLVSDGVLPAGVYQSIRHQIVAVQPQKPASAVSAARQTTG